VFERRIAFCTAILFAFAHWPVRLNRYGWIVTFMTMTFAAAIWLLLLGLCRGRPFYSYLSGVAAGVGLYSYEGARICPLSSPIPFIRRCVQARKITLAAGNPVRDGVATAVFPLICYYLFKPASLSIRAGELSIFNTADPLAILMKNIWRHALMFHLTGGTFARDNFPGLSVLDPLTGVLFIVGLVILIRLIRDNTFARLVASAFVLNFAGGVFSISQEGPPYLYRTAALMVPAFLVVGLGAQWLMGRMLLLTSFGVALAALLNVYLYFGLEARSTAAMRVMSYGRLGKKSPGTICRFS
jgi:hypothetical protein